MSDAPFSKLVPGFDFLQNLVKNAGAALPGIGQWVAPTLDPQEIEKRIEELRTVQFWLEQNARMLGATIQALEVQRMTLSTLKTMNVQMTDLGEAMKIRLPEMPGLGAPAPAPSPAPQTSRSAGPEAERTPAAAPGGEAAAPGPAGGRAAAPTAAPAAGIVDPMQWWGALTQQFTELAAGAMRDGGPGQLAGAMMQQSLQAAEEAMQNAVGAPMPGLGQGKPPRSSARKGAAGKASSGSASPRGTASAPSPSAAPARGSAARNSAVPKSAARKSAARKKAA